MAGIIIDAHQHVWDRARARYDWLGPELAPIDQTMTFTELKPSLLRAGVDATLSDGKVMEQLNKEFCMKGM